MFAFPAALAHLDPLARAARTVLENAAPGMPPELWGLTAAVLGLLALAALIDAFTSTVPDILILLGIAAIAALQAMFGPWQLAALHVGQALAAGLVVWAVNALWYSFYHYDALGMGDAKWTMLAVAGFGVLAPLFAWGIGAVLASAFILTARLFRYRVTRVTFAPFLFVGLVAGLYVLRFWLI